MKGANKIRDFLNKCVEEKRKLLVKELDTQVKDLFLNSLDDQRNMSPAGQTIKNSNAPIIPRINRRQKPGVNNLMLQHIKY